MNPQAAPWLFVSYGGGHVKALLPVARRARELGLAQPVYLALTTAAAGTSPSLAATRSIARVLPAIDLTPAESLDIHHRNRAFRRSRTRRG